MTVQFFTANFKWPFNLRSSDGTNMELKSANENPSHGSFIVGSDKQAYKQSLQMATNVKNSEQLK